MLCIIQNEIIKETLVGFSTKDIKIGKFIRVSCPIY